MEHSEAVQQMAAERYLLGELSPELRDAFEEHFFDCPECALDLRVAAAFVQEAKSQLPDFKGPSAARPQPIPMPQRRDWFSWWRPAIAVPAFVALLAVIGYQNLVTIRSLRSASQQPRLLPWITLHAETRGFAHMPVLANRESGVVLLIDLPQDAAYSSFAFELNDPQARHVWSQTVSASAESSNGGPLSLLIPAAGLQQGPYTLTISGITPQGNRTQLDRRTLDVHF